MGPSIGIIGGGGFLGINLYERLKNDGLDVRVLDIEKNERIEDTDFRHFDVLNPVDHADSLVDLDVVFYRAGLKGPEPSFQDPLKFYRINLEGTLKTLQQCVEHDVNIFVYDSSESAFGKRNVTPFGEDEHPRPDSVYGSTKVMAENYILYVSKMSSINSTIFRYPRVVSAENRNVLKTIGKKVAKNEIVEISASGKKRFDLVSLEDVVEWNRWIIDNQLSGILHVTGGFKVSAQEIARKASEFLHGTQEYGKLKFTDSLSANDKLLPDVTLLDNTQSKQRTSLNVQYNDLDELFYPILSKIESDIDG